MIINTRIISAASPATAPPAAAGTILPCCGDSEGSKDSVVVVGSKTIKKKYQERY
jgi:hypothetical protein